jgi:dCTP deaminase
MAFLSNESIKYYIYDEQLPSDRKIKITPEISEIQIGQCSIDLELSTQFARFKKPYFSFNAFDLQQKSTAKSIQKHWYRYLTVTENEGIAIKPNEVVIAISKEWVGLPKNMFGFITGRSSFSRMGIEVQLTQNLHQPGHNAQILLQIKNNSPFTIRLYPGMRIAQLMIGLLDKDCKISYDENPNSKYVAGKTGISANWFQDFELKEKEFITKSTYTKALLDAILIVFALITIIYTVLKIIQKSETFDVYLIIFCSVTTIVLILRLINYFKN